MTETENYWFKYKRKENQNYAKKSFLWSRDRTYSVFVKEKGGKILQRWKNLNQQYAALKFEELKNRYSFLNVSLNLDVKKDCLDCKGSGLWNVNKIYVCPKCGGTGYIVLEEEGIKLKSNQ
jgi:DnaJ-class molecular chaperone